MRTRLLLPLLALLFLLACAHTGNYLATTAATVDSTMKSWSRYVALGHATEWQERQVREFYVRYQQSMNVATNAYVLSFSTTNQSDWLAASNILSASQVALLNLINGWTTK